MLLILRSTARSCASTSAFPVRGVSVMDDAPEPMPVVAVAPLEFAVPAELVPGGDGAVTFAALPTPLGSLTELLRPPAPPGPEGTPLIDPAPAEPALDVLAAAPVPADAPPALPPAPWANPPTGDIRSAIRARVAGFEILVIEKLRFKFNDGKRGQFRETEQIQHVAIEL
jgi:hypothetical protein